MTHEVIGLMMRLHTSSLSSLEQPSPAPATIGPYRSGEGTGTYMARAIDLELARGSAHVLLTCALAAATMSMLQGTFAAILTPRRDTAERPAREREASKALPMAALL